MDSTSPQTVSRRSPPERRRGLHLWRRDWGKRWGLSSLSILAAGVLWGWPVEVRPEGPAGKTNTAVIPVPGGGETWKTRNDAINARAKQGHVDLIYIGDSIVRSWMWDGTPVWDHYYAKRKGMILGMTGDRTEQVLWRLQNGNIDGISPKLAILMIGQNNGPFNTGEEIGAGVTAIVQLLRHRLPETKILVLAIFPRGEKPTPERAVLARANEVVAKLADGTSVFYLDVNHLFLQPDGGIRASLMPDFEHPNEAGHRAWAAAIEPKVAELLGDHPIAAMPPKTTTKSSEKAPPAP